MTKSNVKNYILPFAICLLIAIALYPNSTLNPEEYSTAGLELDYTVSKDLAMTSEELEVKQNMFTPYLGKSFEGFKEALAFKESQGNYFRVNTLGYLGKYQFGSETLKLIGIYTPNQFLYNPELQEKAFIANAERNKWVLRKDIKRFEGRLIGGIEVTESGILAAAHLAGPGSVKKFLRSYGTTNFSDAYGSSVIIFLNNKNSRSFM